MWTTINILVNYIQKNVSKAIPHQVKFMKSSCQKEKPTHFDKQWEFDVEHEQFCLPTHHLVKTISIPKHAQILTGKLQ